MSCLLTAGDRRNASVSAGYRESVQHARKNDDDSVNWTVNGVCSRKKPTAWHVKEND